MMKTDNTVRGWAILSLAVLGGLLPYCTATGQSGDYVPVYHPTLAITPAAGPIRVDGDLEDAGWQGAAQADNFAEHNPGDQTKPDVATEVLITYDADNLYIAFRCYDNPSEVRASFCTRDNIFSDDNVFACLDTYGESAVGYEIAANPYGIQGDLLYSAANGEDATYDLIYQTSGRITDLGWVVEMAVPFASLRFPDREEQVWRVDFWRNRPRGSQYQYSWAAYDRNESCWPCQWGTVTGISGVRSGAGLELLPAVLVHQSGSLGEQARFKNDAIKGDVGVGVAYDISSEWTAEATVNPDFSQVESDAPQIDVNTTFALFYPERRPFFQEGSDLFNTYFISVYTRSINDPLVAGKMTWRKGPNSLAFLSARDQHTVITLPFEENSEYVENGKSYSNILRGKMDLGRQSHLGFVATDRRFDGGGAGSLLGIDGKLRLSPSDAFKFQVLATHTREVDNAALGDTSLKNIRFDDDKHTAAFDGEDFWGHAWLASLSRDSRDYEAGADYIEYSPTFRADNGLEPSNNARTGSVWLGGILRFKESRILQSIYARTAAAEKWNSSGVRKEKWLDASLEASLRTAQTAMHARYVRSNERFGGVQFDGTWFAHDCLSFRPSGALTCGANITYGHTIAREYLVMGKELTYGYWADIRPIDRLLASFSYSHCTSDDLDTGVRLFSQLVFRTRLSMQMLRELSARLVLQYNDRYDSWDVDPLVTYQINPFSIFYVGAARDYQDLSLEEDGRQGWTLTNRQYFLKLQYLFRI